MVTKLIFIVGVALILFGIRALNDDRDLRSSGIRVTGEVIETTPPTKEMRLPREGRVTVRYEYAGATHRVSSTAHDKFWASLKPGDKVELALSPKDPTRFVPAPSLARSGYLGWTLIGGGIVLIVIGVLKKLSH